MNNKKRISKKINQINFKSRYKFKAFQFACRFVSRLIERELRKNRIQKKYPLGGFINDKVTEVIINSSGIIHPIPVPSNVVWNQLTLTDGQKLFYVPLDLITGTNKK